MHHVVHTCTHMSACISGYASFLRIEAKPLICLSIYTRFLPRFLSCGTMFYLFYTDDLTHYGACDCTN